MLCETALKGWMKEKNERNKEPLEMAQMTLKWPLENKMVDFLFLFRSGLLRLFFFFFVDLLIARDAPQNLRCLLELALGAEFLNEPWKWPIGLLQSQIVDLRPFCGSTPNRHAYKTSVCQLKLVFGAPFSNRLKDPWNGQTNSKIGASRQTKNGRLPVCFQA